MKKLFKIISIYLFIIVIELNAQEWVNVNPLFDPPGNYNTHNGCFVDTKHGWWLTRPLNEKLLSTGNGGSLWTVLDSTIGGEKVEFIDTLHGWVWRYNGMAITKDGGKNWSRYRTPIIGGLTFFDTLNGFAGGNDTIYATTDGGVTWQPQSNEPDARFFITDIYFADERNGWAVGYSSIFFDAGIILNTTDGGKYWKVNQHPTMTGQAVYFTDSLHGYVVGSNPPFFYGVIKVTNDGGVTWKTHYLPSTWLNDVVFTDDSTGWVVGDYGFIWQTTDRGLSWNRIESGTTSHLYRIFFFDNGRVGYILGADRTLLKYDRTVGIYEEDQFNAPSFELNQNYPNPFNSQTVMEFTIPNREMVRIEVYDVLGRRVKTLMNKILEPGKHSVSFDASGLPSGVYYYRLTAGTFTAVKKLLLLK